MVGARMGATPMTRTKPGHHDGGGLALAQVADHGAGDYHAGGGAERGDRPEDCQPVRLGASAQPIVLRVKT